MDIEHLNGVKKYIALLIFAIAMGFLEAIVVVYIRELYYPGGFEFPLKMLPAWLVLTEWIREITTLLMLGAVAWISGNILLKRLSVFLFLFGVWDITYYVALKLFLNWPESLFTWDILFLIPITWVSPVIAPVICSLLMIIMALLFEYYNSRNKLEKLKPIEWILIFAGAFIIYFSFTYDFGMIILKGNYISNYFSLAEHPGFLEELTTWIPNRFNWEIFFTGILIICAGIILVLKRAMTKPESHLNRNV